MATKVGIGVLVVVIALFVAVVAGSGAEDGNASDRQDGVVGALLDRFGAEADVALADVEGCERSGVTLQVLQSCSLTVAGSDERFRVLRLRADGAIGVTAPAPSTEDGGSERSVSKDFDAGADIEIAVDSEGARVVLRCVCRVTVTGGGT